MSANGEARHALNGEAIRGRDQIEPLMGLSVPVEILEHVADLVAARVADLLQMSSSPWLGVEESAVYLACSRERIYDLVQSGRLDHARDGRRLLFRREHLDGCLAAATPTPTRSGSGIAQRPSASQASGRGVR